MKKQNTIFKNDVLHEFAANLQKAVNDTGLTPYVLAKKLGLDKQIISNLLRGGRDPKLSTVIHIIKKMQISADQLLGTTLKNKASQQKDVAEINVKKKNLSLIDKISVLNEQDIELLEAIVGVLEVRKARAASKFLSAVQDAKPSTKERGNQMANTTEKVMKSQTVGPTPDDDFDDDDGFEDDDFDDCDDFDEDDGFDDDDDYDEESGEDNEGIDDDDIDYDDFD
jgi:transcriptional regulator with XRE-family HTH domain